MRRKNFLTKHLIERDGYMEEEQGLPPTIDVYELSLAFITILPYVHSGDSALWPTPPGIEAYHAT